MKKIIVALAIGVIVTSCSPDQITNINISNEYNSKKVGNVTIPIEGEPWDNNDTIIIAP